MFQVAELVRGAVAGGIPVVALESTIFTHGMPYPQNVETALAVEQVVVKSGAIPATIGVVEGILKVGLMPGEIERLACGKEATFKAAAKDLAFVLATKQHAGTTVSATMHAANLAGIRVFATGGIGGVHRDAELTFDVSSDLLQFTNTPVAVVSAGCKSILDIPRTLEYLETIGVPVIGYSCTEFPAFHSRSSGVSLVSHTNNVEDIANCYRSDRFLKRSNGILVANPIPIEAEIPFAEVSVWIEEALIKLKKKGISGKGVTPFLLSEIGTLSSGRALSANISLVLNNAKIASCLASALSRN